MSHSADAVEGEDAAGKNLIAQNDELEVIDAIYPSAIETLPNPTGKPSQLLHMTIPISLPSTSSIRLDSANAASSSSSVELSLDHLPPLSVRLVLPVAYPAAEPPRCLSIRASIPDTDQRTAWLGRSALAAVQRRIGTMWAEDKAGSEEGSGVIWKWWDWIGTGEFLDDLKYTQAGRVSLPIPQDMSAAALHTHLKAYNASQLNSSFERTAFSCSICLENRKGKSCIRIPDCDCIFCAPCLSSCWTLAIEEGTLENVACPSFACVKKRATLAANDVVEPDRDLVAEVVGTRLRDRWEDLKAKRRAEIDPAYTICPRAACQAAVPPPPAPSVADLEAQAAISSRAIRLSDLSKARPAHATDTPPATPVPHDAAAYPSDDRWARYRICPKCNFSFCLYCSATWHGPHTPCAFPQTSALVLEYLSYPEGSRQRADMEARRGKTNLERMVSKWQEDEANKKWLETSTRACAGCGVRVEKSHGCNHMTCGRCGTHFCYRCGSSIKPQDPYAHFRTPGRSCFEKLFDQEEIERFERETAADFAGLALADAAEVDDWRAIVGVW